MSIHDPMRKDKEGNEISLIDILEAENEDIIEYIQLNMEIEKMKDYLSILDEREKEVIIYRYGLSDYKEMTQRSEEHTSELQSRGHLVCRLLLEKKKKH